MKDNEKDNSSDTVNVQIEIPVRNSLKIIAIESDIKLKDLTNRILKKFIKDYSKDKTIFTKMSAALNSN